MRLVNRFICSRKNIFKVFLQINLLKQNFLNFWFYKTVPKFLLKTVPQLFQASKNGFLTYHPVCHTRTHNLANKYIHFSSHKSVYKYTDVRLQLTFSPTEKPGVNETGFPPEGGVGERQIRFRRLWTPRCEVVEKKEVCRKCVWLAAEGKKQWKTIPANDACHTSYWLSRGTVVVFHCFWLMVFWWFFFFGKI